MARTTLTVWDLTRTGSSLGFWSQTVLSQYGGQFRNTGREFVRIYNPNPISIAVVVPIPGTVDDAAVSSKSWLVTTGAYLYLPPFPSDIYNQQNEMVYLDAILGDFSVVVFRDGT